MTDPIEINGETFAPVLVECPACGAEIDAQRALYEQQCPAPRCRAGTDELLATTGEGPPEDYEPDSYKVSA
jgi:hypothetical protein